MAVELEIFSRYGYAGTSIRELSASLVLAFAYTAPISALIHLCGREPEKTEAAMWNIEAFSRIL